MEYQSEPLTMTELPAMQTLIDGIDVKGAQHNSGGHIHVSRTDNQTEGRWYWALMGLTPDMCKAMNMRHALPRDEREDSVNSSYWCSLCKDYSGKHTAVNGDHSRTIELRTFSYWASDTAHRFTLAVKWVHAMWRFFQSHPKYSLETETIMSMSRTMFDAVKPQYFDAVTERVLSLNERSEKRKAELKARHDLEQAAIRERVLENIKADKRARRAHWKRYMKIAAREREQWANRRASRRAVIEGMLKSPYCAFSAKNARLNYYRHCLDNEIMFVPRTVIISNPATNATVCRFETTYQVRKVLDNLHENRRALKSHGVKPKYTGYQAQRLLVRLGLIESGQRYR